LIGSIFMSLVACFGRPSLYHSYVLVKLGSLAGRVYWYGR